VLRKNTRKRLSPRISSNVLLLGLVSFLNDSSSEMILPILPIFISTLGGAGLVTGAVGGLRDSISCMLTVLCGYWSDRIGKRKGFVFSGYLTSSVFKLLLGFSRACSQIMVSVALERVGKAMRSAPRDAIIADSMPKERGRGFGIHRTLDTSGAIGGSIGVFLLFWCLGLDFKSIILIAAVVAFLSLIPLHFVTERKAERQSIAFRVSLRQMPGPLKTFIIISSLFALANFSYMFFILRAQEFFSAAGGGDRSGVGASILLYVLFNVFYAIFAIPSGTLSDRIGRRKVISLGYLLFSITCLGFVLLNSLRAFVVLFALYGIVNAVVDGNQRAYVSDLSPAELRATALGTFHTAVGLAALPASLIAGLLWQRVSASTTFAYGSAVSLLSVALFVLFRKRFA